MADAVSPPPEVSPNQDPYALIAERAAERVFEMYRKRCWMSDDGRIALASADEFELALLHAALDAVSEARPAIFAAGVAAGRTRAAAEIAEKIQAALDEPHEAMPFDHESHRGLRLARAMVRDVAEGSDG